MADCQDAITTTASAESLVTVVYLDMKKDGATASWNERSNLMGSPTIYSDGSRHIFYPEVKWRKEINSPSN